MPDSGGEPVAASGAVTKAQNPKSAVNDFVVKFANVNGSGSASTNGLFARSVMRMGVPVAARNIFPSNIQGLPTWYEVRITEAGHMGRRGGVDLMVAMNPQTWDRDLAEIESGGFVFYDSTKPIPASRFRSDITVVGVPLTAMCNEAYELPRERQLFKNVIYVGALSALLGIDIEAVKGLIADDFAGRQRLIDANFEALAMGHSYVTKHLGALPLQVRRADAVGNRIYVEGNQAAALGAVYGGATVCAWYPITPSTSLAEAFTATSGPGISLMTEFIGLSYFAEIPAVIFDVQRGGPSTGMPTRTQQADLLAAAYAGHGDTKHVMLLPADPGECFEMGALAFDLADRLQTTVFVMLDLDIGMNEWLTEPFKWDDTRKLDRGKVMTAAELEAGADFGRYKEVDGDGIPYRTYPGTHPTKGGYFTRGTSRNPYARYSEEGAVYVDNMERLLRKFDTARTLAPAPIARPAKRKTRDGVLYFGSTTPAMHEALEMLEVQGRHLDAIRVRGFPFAQEIYDFIAAHDRVFVIEQNRDAQLKTLLMTEGGIDAAKLPSVLHYDGTPITARFIAGEIAQRLALGPLSTGQAEAAE